MSTLLIQLSNQVKAAFELAGYSSEGVEVSMSRRPELCDFQCNSALKLSKQYGVNPKALASAVKQQLDGNQLFKSVDVEGAGFINLILSEGYLISSLKEISQSAHFGCGRLDCPQTIVIDYGGANVAKSLHVGHLRSAVIGESLKRLLKFKGHHVIGDIHLGDWGLQMGLVVEMLRIKDPTLPYFDDEYRGNYPSEPPFDIVALTALYTEANILSKSDVAFKDKAAETTAKLQTGHAGYRALWHHILTVSKVDLKKNYSSLSVFFDLWLGESDAREAIPNIIDKLESLHLLTESEGAKVVFVATEADKKSVPPCIIQKQNGAAIYATTDLATIYQRVRDYQPNRIIYVVDKRQALHFEQVFRVARMAQFVEPDVALDFIGFGTMNGKDGKPFKTRDGGVMALEDLIEQLKQSVYAKLMSQNREDALASLDKTAISVGVSALKFADLSNKPERDYVFDIDQFSNFEGKTGPYVQYASVRAKSIINKLGKLNRCDYTFGVPQSVCERDLAFHILMFGSAVDYAVASLQPSKICDYMFDLAQKFNHLYHDTHITSIQDHNRKHELLSLIALTSQLIDQCLDLLGIDAIDQM